jgi:hypothetical protein
MYAFIPYSLVLSVICLSVSVLSHASQETAKYKQISPVSANHADYNNLAGNSNKNNAAAIKYIDFDQGDDEGTGTRDDPWRHHPWDENSRGNAANSHGVNTYVFKKGVTYRGRLFADESGTSDAPIRLTVDPDWGQGDAVLAGSTQVTDGWKLCGEKYTSKLPAQSKEKSWCHTIKTESAPRLLWYLDESGITRIPVARNPDWEITNIDDPRSQWFELTDVIIEVIIEASNTNNLVKGDIVTVQPVKRQSGRLKKQVKLSQIKIIDVQGNRLTLEIRNWFNKLMQPGDTLSNGEAEARIKQIKGTHSIIRRLVDNENLPASTPNAYRGATIWAERRGMPKADAAIIIDSNPDEYSLRANFHRAAGSGPRPHDRYYLEGLPEFLDSAGEYHYQETGSDAGVLILRLPQDRDPNQSIIEVANRNTILEVRNQSNIEITGLAFRFSNQIAPGTRQSRHAPIHASAIQIRGNVDNIKIVECDFSFLPSGIFVFPEVKSGPSRIDYIKINNNSFKEIDGSAIALGNGRNHYKMKKYGSRLIHVEINKNTLANIGYRTLAHYGTGSHGDAIQVAGGEVVEVAENQIERVWGSGISVTTGSEYQRGQVERPFLRSMIHDNTVIDSLLGAQDGGGINAWMGGPAYIYNNISGNPVGCMYSRYKTSMRRNWYRRGCYGVGIYLDGQYKGYVFNNITWGKNNNVNDRIYNSAAFNEAMGFMNSVFHNTFYRFGTGLHKGMFQHNRSYYLGNLFIDMGVNYIQQEPLSETIDYATLAFSHNQFYGEVKNFGKLGSGRSDIYKNLDGWKNAMHRLGLMSHDTGSIIMDAPVQNAEEHDFRPQSDSPAIDSGVKVFVPWALYGVVGEWHFLRRNSNPSVVNGENINMNSGWIKRDMFHLIPRNDLLCENTKSTDYAEGTLEDWIPGALKFDGKSRYCHLSSADLAISSSRVANGPDDRRINSSQRPAGINMASDNFLIETVIRPNINSGPAGLVEKRDSRGYSLELGPTGHVVFTLYYGSEISQRISSNHVNDGYWHHILVEVDRSLPDGISIYIDGELANGEWHGVAMKTASLSNDAEFMLGRSVNGYYAGLMDFLRISHGTLAQAETDIRELYAWEFNGPFLRDMKGNMPLGIRDVGAIEYIPEK